MTLGLWVDWLFFSVTSFMDDLALFVQDPDGERDATWRRVWRSTCLPSRRTRAWIRPLFSSRQQKNDPWRNQPGLEKSRNLSLKQFILCTVPVAFSGLLLLDNINHFKNYYLVDWTCKITTCNTHCNTFLTITLPI